MPTKKPRLMLTLEPETHALLKALSDKQGKSMASLVVEVLDGFVPIMTEVLQAVEQVERLEEAKRAKIKGQFESAEKDMLPMLELVQARMAEAFASADQLANDDRAHDDDTLNPNQETTSDADDARHPSQRTQA